MSSSADNSHSPDSDSPDPETAAEGGDSEKKQGGVERRRYKTRIRPDMVHRGKVLAGDPCYPDRAVVETLAEKLAPQFRRKG